MSKTDIRGQLDQIQQEAIENWQQRLEDHRLKFKSSTRNFRINIVLVAIAVFIIGAVSGSLSWLALNNTDSTDTFLGDAGLNFGTEMLGAVVTFVLLTIVYDRINSRNIEETEYILGVIEEEADQFMQEYPNQAEELLQDYVEKVRRQIIKEVTESIKASLRSQVNEQTLNNISNDVQNKVNKLVDASDLRPLVLATAATVSYFFPMTGAVTGSLAMLGAIARKQRDASRNNRSK